MRDAPRYVISALGPLEARHGSRRIDLGGRKQRLLLALLVARPDHVVTTASLIDGLWGDDPPSTARKALQMHVSNLRRACGEEFPLRTAPGGYLIQSADLIYDVAEFERLVGEATAAVRTDGESASRLFTEALSLWRGAPFADLDDEPALEGGIARLEELRVGALERRIDADLRAGRHVQVVGELETLTIEHPFRERFREQQMLALYRAGRQSDALRAYERARAVLIEELGIEPSRGLRDLHAQILDQSADLDLAGGSAGQAMAFLATDIVDSTSHWENDPEAMQQALSRHDQILHQAVADVGGTTFKGTGDGIYAVFDAAPNAVAAASAAQVALFAESWPTRSPVRVRMGVDEGPASRRDDDYFGPAMNRVSRVMSAGHGGQILIPTETASRYGTVGLPLEDADFKGVGRVAVTQVSVEGLPSEFPPLQTERSTTTRREGFGRSIRGYELREQLGAGAYGIVFRAFQASIGREVAIKVIRPEYANRTEFIKRFEAEARYVAQLEHPHIAPLYDYWRDPDGAYLVMQLLRGGSLGDGLERAAWKAPAAVRLLDQVGSALDYAHRHGVTHRDLKPANVLLDADGNAFLSDFGIATQQIESQGFAVESSAAYIAPEELAGEPSGRLTDMYGLALLTYEMLTGHRPPLGGQPESVVALRPELPPALDDVLARAAHRDPARRYERVAEYLRDVRHALGSAVAAAQPSNDVAIRNPFKGLRAFQETDAQDFFGRDELIHQLVDHVAQHRLTAVVGPSGSGKSSVVRAGVLPAVRSGALGIPGDVLITEMYPGTFPFDELESALSRIAVDTTVDSIGELLSDERGLLRVCKQILPNDDSEMLLVIDQFEELFSLTSDENTRRQFLANLVALADDERSRVRVVVTLRADFFDRPLEYPEFGALLRASTVPVSMPVDHELASSIAEPARRAGFDFEPGVISRIVSDVRHEPGGLPLMQYALTALAENHVGTTIGLDDYEATGGTSGALATQAEDIFQGLPAATQAAARELFIRLVRVDEHADDTRRRARRSDFEASAVSAAELDDAISAFASFRLLTFDRDPHTRGQTIEVAHEALIRKWPRFCDWVDERRDSLLLERRLESAVADWEQADRDSGLLLSGARLEQFENLAERPDSPMTPPQRELVEASRQHADDLAQRRARARRWVTSVVAGFAVVACLAAIFAFVQRDRANDNARLAEEAANRAATEERLATQLAEAARESEGEALSSAQDAQRAAAQASTEAERARAATATADALRVDTDRRRLAETSRRLALSAGVAAEADVELAVLLAVESVRQADLSSLRVTEPMNALFGATSAHLITERLDAWNVSHTQFAIAATDPTQQRFAFVGADDAGARFVRVGSLNGSTERMDLDISRPTSVAWGRDGQELAVADAAGGLTIVAPDDGTVLRTIETGAGYAKVEELTDRWISYSVPGLLGPGIGTFVVADAATGEVVLRQSNSVYALISDSDRYVVIQGVSEGPRVYELPSASQVAQLPQYQSTLRLMDWIPGEDALWRMLSTDALIRIDMVNPSDVSDTIPLDSESSIVFPQIIAANPTGDVIALGDDTGSAYLIATDDGSVTDVLSAHTNRVTALDWTSQNGLIALDDAPTSQIVHWELEAGVRAPHSWWPGLTSFPLDHWPIGTDSLAVDNRDPSDPGAASIERWTRTADGGVAVEAVTDPSVTAPFVHSDDGTLLVSRRADSSGMRVRDLTNGDIVDIASELTAPLALSPDGRTLIAGVGDRDLFSSDQTAVVTGAVDIESGRPLWSLPGVRSRARFELGTSVAFAEGGNVVLVATGNPWDWLGPRVIPSYDADREQHLLALDSRSGQEIARLVLADADTQIAISPDGETLAISDATGLVRTIDVARFLDGADDIEIGRTVLASAQPTYGMTFSEDGATLMMPAGTASSTLLAFDVAASMDTLWSIDVGMPVSRPVVRDGLVWVAASTDVVVGDDRREIGLVGIPLDRSQYTEWAASITTRDFTDAECELYLDKSCG